MAAKLENGHSGLCVDVFSKQLDGRARGMVRESPLNSINEWYQLREAFTQQYSRRRLVYKEPHEITKVVRRANETLPNPRKDDGGNWSHSWVFEVMK
ncbi:hypothetical protein Tco_0546877 [Tanacetum coccineum]